MLFLKEEKILIMTHHKTDQKFVIYSDITDVESLYTVIRLAGETTVSSSSSSSSLNISRCLLCRKPYVK